VRQLSVSYHTNVTPYTHADGRCGLVRQLSDDGLFFGGDYKAAQGLVRDGKASPFRFKLFMQQTE
jgi:hypothetical protein